jgi:hypothetical protein
LITTQHVDDAGAWTAVWNHIGEPDRDAEVIDVRGLEGAPPYLIRWGDTGHETLFFPGPDATVEHYEHVSS